MENFIFCEICEYTLGFTNNFSLMVNGYYFGCKAEATNLKNVFLYQLKNSEMENFCLVMIMERG